MSWRAHLQDALPPAMPARAREPGLARLDLNEGAFAPSPVEREALRAAIDAVAFERYPDDAATPVRAALAARWRVDPDEVLVGNGSIEIIATLMAAFRRPGAEVLIPAPTFDQYGVLAAAHGLRCVTVPLADGFALDERAVAAAIDRHRPALAFFASPNNPTGNPLDGAALERLARRMDAAFVVDEAYADFAGATMIPRLRDTPGLFVVRTLSKIGFAGLRVGALVGARDAIAALARARLPFSVGAATQALACAALRFPAAIDSRVREIVGLRGELAAALAAVPGVRVYPSSANFLLVRLPGDAPAITRQLAARGVLVRDVSSLPALAGCVRVTVGSAADNRRAVDALRDVLRSRG